MPVFIEELSSELGIHVCGALWCERNSRKDYSPISLDFRPYFVIAQKYGREWSVESGGAKFRNGMLAALDESADVGGPG